MTPTVPPRELALLWSEDDLLRTTANLTTRFPKALRVDITRAVHGAAGLIPATRGIASLLLRARHEMRLIIARSPAKQEFNDVTARPSQ